MTENLSAAEEKSSSAISRIVQVFASPEEAATGIQHKPTWLVPFLIVTVIALLLSFLAMDIRQHDTIAMFEAQDKPPEMIEKVEQQMAGPAKYIQLVAVPVATLAIWAVLSGIILFAGSTILGGESKYKKVFSMVAWSGLISILGGAVQTLLILLKGTAHGVTTSLAVALPTPVLGQTPSLLYRILTQFDVFALWQMWFWVVGVSVLFRFTKQKSATMVFSIWVLWVIVSVVLGGLFSNTMGA